jgi:hypothetical protein
LTKDKDNYLTKGTAASVASSAYAAVPLPSICPENVSLSVFFKIKSIVFVSKPVKSFFSIQYNLEDVGQVKLQIIDNAGRLVKIILQEKNQVFGLKDIL